MSSSATANVPTFTESITPPPPVVSESKSIFFSNNNIIIILCAIIILMLVNTNITIMLRNLLNIVYNFFIQILQMFGYVTGNVIITTADVAADVARTGVDISEGTLQSVGRILANNHSVFEKQPSFKKSLDEVVNTSNQPETQSIPEPDSSANPIQNPISADKSSWCLVGDYKGSRGCVEIGEYDKCLSGQIFPSQRLCLNPALSANV
jgi:hypothetical protein